MFLLFRRDRKSRKPWAWDLGEKPVKRAVAQRAKDGVPVRFPFYPPSCLQTLLELGLCPLLTRFVILQLWRFFFFIFRILAPCSSGGPEDDCDLQPGVLGSWYLSG